MKTEEITLKEIILKSKEYTREVFKGSWIIIMLILLVGVVNVYFHINHEKTYKAKLRFVVEGQTGSGGGINSLLGSFGIKKGGRVNPYKVLEVGKSSRVLNKVLAVKTDKGNIGQEIIESYNLSSEWGNNNNELSNYSYSPSSFDRFHQSVRRKLHKKIWGTEADRSKGIMNFNLDEDTGIYTIIANSNNEGLSLSLSNEMYTQIKLFFEEKVFENQKNLTEILFAKADSLKLLRDQKVYELSRFNDKNRNSQLASTGARRTILGQEIAAFNLAYGEVLKNYEMTDVNLKDMQPLFMTVDTPFEPLPPIKSSLVMRIIKSVILGLFLGVLFIILRKIYKDVLSN